MIDHHENQKNYCDYTYSDPSMSSTCEMVYHFISMLGDENHIDYSISESLYAGIMTDTQDHLDSQPQPMKLIMWFQNF